LKEKNKDEISIYSILVVVFAILISLLFGWGEDAPPEQSQIDASPFENNGFQAEEDRW
jgi:hypothetical protein